jgi:hypothetical protein
VADIRLVSLRRRLGAHLQWTLMLADLAAWANVGRVCLWIFR